MTIFFSTFKIMQKHLLRQNKLLPLHEIKNFKTEELC